MRLANQESIQEQINRFMKSDERETFIDFGFGYGFQTTRNDIEWFEEWEPEFLANVTCDIVITFEFVQEFHEWLVDYATLFDNIIQALDYCTVFMDAGLDRIYVIHS